MLFFLCDKILELLIVVTGVYVGYRLSNKQLSEQIKKENEASQKTELKIYKDKMMFNKLIEFRSHLQKHTEKVSALFLSAADYLEEEQIGFLEESDIKKIDNIKNKVDLKSATIEESKRILNNDLIFLGKFHPEIGELYNELALAYQRLSATINAHIFGSPESKESEINYEFLREFVPTNPETLNKSNKELFNELPSEFKQYAVESSLELRDNPKGLIMEFYKEYFDHSYDLMNKTSEILENQFINLGK